MANDVINEHAPIKKMRVREKDVPFMTHQWKKAIRNKRKYARIFSKERSQENFEMKKKWRNEATKDRRKAVKEYWEQKITEMHSKPREFFNVFKPFLGSKGKRENNNMIRLEINGKIEED